jgi:hypothetical protein
MNSEPVYPDELITRDALQRYFLKYHFENGGYDLKWFKIKVGPIFIPMPNTPGRIRAVKIHDIHHLLTEYPATLKGEAEIGGWEIAAGCGKYYEAWFLNFGSFFYGMFFFPRALFKAFMRGKRAKTSLYYDVNYDSRLLGRTVGDLREYTGVNASGKNTTGDYFAFFSYALALIVTVGLFLCGVIYII